MCEQEYFSPLSSPIGELLLVSNGAALTGVYMESHKGGPEPGSAWRQEDDVLGRAREQLLAYFAGTRFDFDLPVAPRGTVFQQRVWKELQRIPFGYTLSYGELARRLGQATAARAVGAANGRNPLSIIVPCHRVIGADGTLTGYGGGLPRKQWLLRHEAATLVGTFPAGVHASAHRFCLPGMSAGGSLREDAMAVTPYRPAEGPNHGTPERLRTDGPDA